MAPFIIAASLAEASEVSDLDEMCDKVSEDEKQYGLITGSSEKAQLEYDQRINDVVDDLIRLGYYNKIN